MENIIENVVNNKLSEAKKEFYNEVNSRVADLISQKRGNIFNESEDLEEAN